MNTRQKLHQLHLNEWISRFADQAASGLSVRQWCEQNSFSIHTYNYWKHVLKEEVVGQTLPDIAPLSLPVLPPPIPSACPDQPLSTTGSTLRAARIDARGISIDIFEGASEEFLSGLIKAVRHA